MDSASRRFRDNPSFSSTLLDEIYRSIDEQSTACTESIRKKQSKFGEIKSRNGCFEDNNHHHHDNERRACLMQKWTDNKLREKPIVGRRSAADLERSSMRYGRELFCVNSSSSSCDSYCCGGAGGGGFSSSETESVYGVLVKPKPIRTSVHQRDEIIKREKQEFVYGQEVNSQSKSKHEGKFVKTKSKALKIYSDLKKVKQPISPGGRLATFLNSLFTAGNNKKPNTSSSTTATGGGYTARSHLDRKSKSANASTCSSASSFSRSCLSNTPSSRGKLSNGIKRSVRFYPVSVLVDEDCQPCGHKSLHEEETDLNSIKFAQNSVNNKEVKKLNLSDKNHHISQVARNLLKNYHKEVECGFNSTRNNEYEDEFDDGRSDSSSDLFELDHLSAIGINKYREELPVYETTQLDTNRLFMRS